MNVEAGVIDGAGDMGDIVPAGVGGIWVTLTTGAVKGGDTVFMEPGLDGGWEYGCSRGTTSRSADVLLVSAGIASATPFASLVALLVFFFRDPSAKNERAKRHAQPPQTINAPIIAQSDQAIFVGKELPVTPLFGSSTSALAATGGGAPGAASLAAMARKPVVAGAAVGGPVVTVASPAFFLLYWFTPTAIPAAAPATARPPPMAEGKIISNAFSSIFPFLSHADFTGGGAIVGAGGSICVA
mmetsp:Transcript_126255/g.243403  ORF Transcript_126255/g.243403 Transcript_126255/m.243403 type:complete len:242 (+) Transcript_126255:290-1015(+)